MSNLIVIEFDYVIILQWLVRLQELSDVDWNWQKWLMVGHKKLGHQLWKENWFHDVVWWELVLQYLGEKKAEFILSYVSNIH